MKVKHTKKCNLEELNVIILISLKSNLGFSQIIHLHMVSILRGLDSELMDESNQLNCDRSEIGASMQRALNLTAVNLREKIK